GPANGQPPGPNEGYGQTPGYGSSSAAVPPQAPAQIPDQSSAQSYGQPASAPQQAPQTAQYGTSSAAPQQFPGQQFQSQQFQPQQVPHHGNPQGGYPGVPAGPSLFDITFAAPTVSRFAKLAWIATIILAGVLALGGLLEAIQYFGNSSSLSSFGAS